MCDSNTRWNLQSLWGTCQLGSSDPRSRGCREQDLSLLLQQCPEILSLDCCFGRLGICTEIPCCQQNLLKREQNPQMLVLGAETAWRHWGLIR